MQEEKEPRRSIGMLSEMEPDPQHRITKEPSRKRLSLGLSVSSFEASKSVKRRSDDVVRRIFGNTVPEMPTSPLTLGNGFSSARRLTDNQSLKAGSNLQLVNTGRSFGESNRPKKSTEDITKELLELLGGDLVQGGMTSGPGMTSFTSARRLNRESIPDGLPVGTTNPDTSVVDRILEPKVDQFGDVTTGTTSNGFVGGFHNAREVVGASAFANARGNSFLRDGISSTNGISSSIFEVPSTLIRRPDTVTSYHDSCTSPRRSSHVSSFTTAGGTPAKAITPASRKFVQGLLSGMPETTSDEQERFGEPPSKVESPGSGKAASLFSTAAGSPVRPISDVSYKKAAYLFTDRPLHTNDAPRRNHTGTSHGSKSSVTSPLRPVDMNINRVIGVDGSRPLQGAFASHINDNNPFSKSHHVIPQNDSRPLIPFETTGESPIKSVSVIANRDTSRIVESSGAGADPNSSDMTHTVVEPVDSRTGRPRGMKLFDGMRTSESCSLRTTDRRKSRRFVPPRIVDPEAKSIAGDTPSRASRTPPLALFDCSVQSKRLRLEEEYGKPCPYSQDELLRSDLPRVIQNLSLDSAGTITFCTSECSNWGVQDAHRDLLAAGALETIASFSWVQNHYRWITWKLAAIIRNYHRNFSEVLEKWSATEVMLQLRFRYERENNQCKRPLLRQVVECDKGSQYHMVLCVSRVIDTTDIRNPKGEQDLETSTHGWMVRNNSHT
ncbi:hypothetical protein M427DRAFT_429997 [Gonapodya prolifera JEL478]|uniref:Breast cancer type 2 susceptibility protein helical domain-containing protein n=1 Tax=Gonapodya prolifera (strain JEL478) TaxID=1344416 RepID=A0A139ASR6_GONPJ|nr:hypothetical protein M427DRAFT_429997 [Gonapodya prolifera JEL478]|eukprot:KXS19788.1 hypothetical protein M427DRAFT_429997 [Gonapodya prolifera JEL478]